MTYIEIITSKFSNETQNIFRILKISKEIDIGIVSGSRVVERRVSSGFEGQPRGQGRISTLRRG